MKLKPGMMAFINHKCKVPENIGLVVEVGQCTGVQVHWGQAYMMWKISSKSPIQMTRLDLGSGKLVNSRTTFHSEIPEEMLTPINGDGLLNDESQEKHHDVPALL